jgi:hypothetical protein
MNTRGADKSLARPTSRCIYLMRIFRLLLVLFYIYIYIYITNIPPVMIINRIYFFFLALQPIVVVFSQPRSGL